MEDCHIADHHSASLIIQPLTCLYRRTEDHCGIYFTNGFARHLLATLSIVDQRIQAHQVPPTPIGHETTGYAVFPETPDHDSDAFEQGPCGQYIYCQNPNDSVRKNSI